MMIVSVNGNLPDRFASREIIGAYPSQGFFVVEYAATVKDPFTKVYFSPEGKEVFEVQDAK